MVYIVLVELCVSRCPVFFFSFLLFFFGKTIGIICLLGVTAKGDMCRVTGNDRIKICVGFEGTMSKGSRFEEFD